MVRQYRYIDFRDREQIAARYLNGDRVADIAAGLGVTTATVYRELKRGETGELDRNQRREYNPVLAQQRVQASFKRRGKPAAVSSQGGVQITCFIRADAEKQGEAWLRSRPEYPVFDTRIRYSEKVTESTFSEMPIAEYSRRSGTAMDYIAFVREYLQRGKA